MAVFPENMDKLNVEDPAASLSVIENYIRYMSERIEFSMRNMTKTVSAAGVSSAELYILLQAQAQLIATLQSAIGIIQGDITSLQHSVQTAEGNITALQGDISTLQSSVSALQGSMSAAQGDITAIQSTLADHESRIYALEHPPTT